MAVEELIRHLGEKYDETKLVPPTTMKSVESREYRLYPLGAGSFVNYEPTDVKEKFNVLAVDSGSTALFDTPYWGIGLLKLKARLIEFDPKAKRGKTVEQAARSGSAFSSRTTATARTWCRASSGRRGTTSSARRRGSSASS